MREERGGGRRHFVPRHLSVDRSVMYGYGFVAVDGEAGMKLHLWAVVLNKRGDESGLGSHEQREQHDCVHDVSMNVNVRVLRVRLL